METEQLGKAAAKRLVADVQRTIDAVWRIESTRLIAGLARMVGDVGLAEDLAQDALRRRAGAVAGVGRAGQPGRLAHDHGQASRHRPAAPSHAARAQAGAARLRDRGAARARRARSRRRAGRRHRRRACCGSSSPAVIPVLSTEARVALTLRLLGGLTTPEIARAFLVPEATVAQRIVRAKRTLAEARVPFEVPRGGRAARTARLGARGHLPRVQRRLLRDRGRRLDARRPLRGRAAHGTRARRR